MEIEKGWEEKEDKQIERAGGKQIKRVNGLQMNDWESQIQNVVSVC